MSRGLDRPSARMTWAGVVCIAAVGLIHLVEMPEYFEYAAYLGLLFLANGIASVAAAAGIARDARWGWLLGALLAGGAFVAYIWSRSVGLPHLPDDDTEWLEPLGIAALVLEAGFVTLAVSVLTSPAAARRRAPVT